MSHSTIDTIDLRKSARKAAQTSLSEYLHANAHRIDYAAFRARGIAIGSGPMESFHRTASQKRLKLPGARWTEENSQGVLNLRLMHLAGNSERFWNQPDIDQKITLALAT